MSTGQSRSSEHVTATTILSPDQFVTGVRGLSSGEVVLSGTAVGEGVQNALIYTGSISPTNPSGVHILTPAFAGQTVTGAAFYGPDTFAFNPSLGAGNIRAVGSYTYADSGERNHGLLYQGPPSGGGTWTQIDVPRRVVGGKVVENTLAHSTMGDLVVGNYDLQGVPASANASATHIGEDALQIHPSATRGSGAQHALKDRAAQAAADNPCEGIANRTKTFLFHCRPGEVAADRSAHCFHD